MNENINDKLNKGPVDIWSTREKLALASAVMRSGNQNWVSVSRSIRPFVDSGRPADWFSQINCARQYQEMLEKAGTSRRKRGDKDFSDAPGDVIVRKLVTERIEELKSTISDLADKYKHLKKELEHVKSGSSGDSLKEVWQKLLMEKTAALEARKVSEEQAMKMHSPSKEDLSTSQILEHSYVQDTCEDVEQNTTTDSLSLDDQLSQSTSSSHITENVASIDLPACAESRAMPFDVEVKQEQAASLDPDSEKRNVNEEQVEEREVKEDSPATEIKQEVKVEVKDEPNETTEEMKDEGKIVEEQAAGHDESNMVEDAREQLQEEVAMESQDVEDDIVISTEEIVEDTNDNGNKSILEPGSTTQEPEGNEGNADIGHKMLENDDPNENLQEEDLKVFADEPEKKDSEELQKSPLYTPLETNIEEPKTHDSVDTEPSAIAEGSDAKTTILSKNEDEYIEPASVGSSSDAASKTKNSQPNKLSSKNKTKKETKRKSNFIKIPKTPIIKEEGKESEISSKAGSSDEEGKNLDEPIKASGSFIKSKLDLNESLPNSPASVCNSDTDDERNHKAWKKSIMLVWRAISNHKFANIFMHPVTEDIAPGYHNVIFKPMDLNTIRKNIDLGIIRNTRDFQRDMMLMFTNAIMYNHSSHDVHKMARVMYQDSMTQIEQFVNTQVMMRSEPKLLRTSRRSDTGISDKEEERKRKASEAEAGTPVTTKKRRH